MSDVMVAVDPARVAREFGPLISSLAYQFFGNREEAQDAAQEAWTEIIKDLNTFQGQSSLKTWVYQVAWRKMLRVKKRAERTHRLRDLRAEYDERTLEGPADFGADARLWAEETCRNCMTGVLFCLTPEQRLSFLFRYTAQLSYEEIATILETTVENARQLYSRGRAVLARFMTGECSYARSDHHCSYGVHRWSEPTGLLKAFTRMREFGSAVAAYRHHPQLMPSANYWEAFLRT